MKGLVLLSCVSVASGADPCCKACVAPLVKYYSVDVSHGFCGETCINPSRYGIYKIFEKNLTLSDSDTPCSEQFTPVGTHYTEYSDTVTHGVPGLLAVTLDLYGPGATVAAAAQVEGYQCPGSPSFFHASMKTTATAATSCAKVQKEIEARAGGSWVDPHNGGIYSVLSSNDGLIQTQRTTNPATSVGGKVYIDKQTFSLSDADGSCQIKACSESQSASAADFSTNYCDLRNLYCGSADGCTPAGEDFTSEENSHSGSALAGHDFSACIVKSIAV